MLVTLYEKVISKDGVRLEGSKGVWVRDESVIVARRQGAFGDMTVAGLGEPLTVDADDVRRFVEGNK